MEKWKRRMFFLLSVLLVLPQNSVLAAGRDKGIDKQLEQMLPREETFLFEDGDVVGFMGDSITHVEYTGISYQEFLYNYYITRYPGWELEFRNLGTASYQALDAVALYGDQEGIQDPAIEGITKAVLMFGMNEALDNVPVQAYLQNMRRLVEILRERGLEQEDIILVAPTPYDQTRSSNYTEAGEQIEKIDDRLQEYVGALKDLSAKLGTHYVDLHSPMLWITDIVQGKIPDDTLTVRDNVHPNAMGNTIAGFFFLYQQGADPMVSDVEILSEAEVRTRNARVKKLKCKGDRYIRFQYEAGSLPMAVSYEFHEATQYFPIIDQISRENLKIESLEPESSYTVYMEGLPVAAFTGEELGAGVNLTNLDLNPRQAAAKEIEVLNQKWQRVSSDYRSVIREATKRGSLITQAEVEEAHAVFKASAEAIRKEMYSIARKGVSKACRIEIVSEDYHVWMGQEVRYWAMAIVAAGAVLMTGEVLFWRRKRRR